jgi:hypothetical protein
MQPFKHHCRFFTAKKHGYTLKIYNFGICVKKQPIKFYTISNE